MNSNINFCDKTLLDYWYLIPNFNAPYAVKDQMLEIFSGKYDVKNYEPTKPIVILDIGACFGYFTMWATERWLVEKVYCYEPFRERAKKLAKNLSQPWMQKHKNKGNVTVYDKAIRGDDGYARFYPGDCDSFEGSFFMGEQELDYEPAKFMSSSMLPSANVIKISAPGCERDILENIFFIKTKKWDESYDLVLVDTNDSSVIELLEDGYKCINKNGKTLKFIRKDLCQK